MDPELAEKQAKKIIRTGQKRLLTPAQLGMLAMCLENLPRQKRSRLEGMLKKVIPGVQLKAQQGGDDQVDQKEDQGGQSSSLAGRLSQFEIDRGDSKSPGAMRETILRCVSFRHLAKNKTAFKLHNEFSCKGVLLLKLEVPDEAAPDAFPLLAQHYPHSISLSSGTQLSNRQYFETILEENTYMRMEKVTCLQDLLLESEQFVPFSYLPPQCVIDTLAAKWNGVLLAIDCEMVHTTVDENDLARLTVVACDTRTDNIQGSIFTLVSDSYVLFPDNVQIVDYKTQYSGITEEILQNSGSRHTKKAIRDMLLDLIVPKHLHALLYIENTSAATNLMALEEVKLPILVGHGIENDLRALDLIYPLIIDTSVTYQFGTRKPRLQDLAQRYLFKFIQGDIVKGHNSTEDAEAALYLVLLRLELSGIPVATLFPSSTRSALAVKNAQKYFTMLREKNASKCQESAASLSQMLYKYQVMKSEAIGQYAYGTLPMYQFKMVQHFTMSGARSKPTLGELLVWLSQLPANQKKLCIAIPEPVLFSSLIAYLNDVALYTTPHTLIICIVHAGDITICPLVSSTVAKAGADPDP